jgi:hypothetical protein
LYVILNLFCVIDIFASKTDLNKTSANVFSFTFF